MHIFSPHPFVDSVTKHQHQISAAQASCCLDLYCVHPAHASAGNMPLRTIANAPPHTQHIVPHVLMKATGRNTAAGHRCSISSIRLPTITCNECGTFHLAVSTCPAQHSTAQHITAQHITAHHSTAQVAGMGRIVPNVNFPCMPQTQIWCTCSTFEGHEVVPSGLQRFLSALFLCSNKLTEVSTRAART